MWRDSSWRSVETHPLLLRRQIFFLRRWRMWSVSPVSPLRPLPRRCSRQLLRARPILASLLMKTSPDHLPLSHNTPNHRNRSRGGLGGSARPGRAAAGGDQSLLLDRGSVSSHIQSPKDRFLSLVESRSDPVLPSPLSGEGNRVIRKVGLWDPAALGFCCGPVRGMTPVELAI